MNIKNILTKIILSDLHLYLFYGFILSIPFQIRKRFLTEYSYFAGGFSEYATFFIYLSDVLLILAVFFWLVKITIRRDGDLSRLRYKLSRFFYTGHTTNRVSTIFKSIYKNTKIGGSAFPIFSLRKKLPLYKRRLGGVFKKTWLFVIQNKPLTLLFIFCLWLVVDLLLISEDYFSISAYQTLKFLELAIFFVYVYFNLASFKRILIIVGLLALSGLIQSLLAVSQYFLQHSVFGSKWLGEIVLSPELPGVAKIVVDGEKIMRAYGTFPHPNILAGFLLVTIFLSWYLLTNYLQFINKDGKNKNFSLFSALRKTKGLILHNKSDNLSSKDEFKTCLYNRIKNVSRETFLSIFFTFLIFIQILALILTFSRSGWLGFFVVLLILSIIPLLRRGWECVKSASNPPLAPPKRGIFSSENPPDPFLQRGKSEEGNKDNVSRETFLNKNGFETSPYKNHFFNKNALNILFLVLLTIFSIIHFWPEISSRNLLKLESGNFLDRNGFETYPYSHYNRINNVSRETLLESENKENQNRDLAITDRLFYNKIAIDNIGKYSFTGTGLGVFIFQIDNYLNVSRETLLESVGMGLKPIPIKNSPGLEFWRYQPAHNIYLLITSEIGIVGFLIFALFVIQIIKESGENALNKQDLEIKKINVSRETLPDNRNREQKFISRDFLLYQKAYSTPSAWNTEKLEEFPGKNISFLGKGKSELKTDSTHFQVSSERETTLNVSRETFNVIQTQKNLQHFLVAIFIGFLIIGLFDHYFWTIQQGRLEFWLILGLIITNGEIIKK